MITKFLYKLAVTTVGATLSLVVLEASNIRLVQAANLTFNFNVSDYRLDRLNGGYVLQNTQSGIYSVDADTFNAALSNNNRATIPINEGGSLAFIPAGSFNAAGSYFNISLGSINRLFPEVSENLNAPGFGDLIPSTAINCGRATCGATYIGRLASQTLYRQTPVFVPEPSYALPILIACGLLVNTVCRQRDTKIK